MEMGLEGQVFARRSAPVPVSTSIRLGSRGGDEPLTRIPFCHVVDISIWELAIGWGGGATRIGSLASGKRLVCYARTSDRGFQTARVVVLGVKLFSLLISKGVRGWWVRKSL